jgi:phosphonate transport system substrate-binding protein
VIDPARIVTLDLTDDIPNYPITMQGNLAPDLKQSIRDAFLGLKDKEVLRSFRVDGFASTNDKAYDVLRDTARILKLDLARMK